MATIDSKEFIDKLIAGNGWHPDCGDIDEPDNPRARLIVEYTNMAGKRTWGVEFMGDRRNRYTASEYVIDPVIIWNAEDHPL